MLKFFCGLSLLAVAICAQPSFAGQCEIADKDYSTLCGNKMLRSATVYCDGRYLGTVYVNNDTGCGDINRLEYDGICSKSSRRQSAGPIEQAANWVVRNCPR